MQLSFTKMQGAGNDFVVLDGTQTALRLTPAHYRRLCDRHVGVGADQVLTVRSSPIPGVDFAYVIHNADGGEVEQCGNGARCFVRYVVDKGLTTKRCIKVLTKSHVIELMLLDNGLVAVDMGKPLFEPAQIPLDTTFLLSGEPGAFSFNADEGDLSGWQFVPVSMGNPHAVILVNDVDAAPVQSIGTLCQTHPAFPHRINVGFMQIIDRHHTKLRVFERGSGETLACGTGACSAVVAGIRMGLLDQAVHVAVRGGELEVHWAGAHQAVFLHGPAVTVFEGTIELPEHL